MQIRFPLLGLCCAWWVACSGNSDPSQDVRVNAIDASPDGGVSLSTDASFDNAASSDVGSLLSDVLSVTPSDALAAGCLAARPRDGRSCDQPQESICSYDTSSCRASCRCRSDLHTWTCINARSSACAAIVCPQTQPVDHQTIELEEVPAVAVVGGAQTPWRGLSCVYGSNCPTLCTLEYSNAGGYHWRCAAAASCQPESCPSAAPFPDPQTDLPAACNEASSCAYLSDGCTTRCDCDGSFWSCQTTHCECPAAPPTDGQVAPSPLYVGRECWYPSWVCVAVQQNDSQSRATHWDCEIPDSCPSIPPNHGDTCLASTGAECAYDVQPSSCGSCHCVNGLWQCQYQCHVCPALAPQQLTPCDDIGAFCQYPGAQPADLPRRCRCGTHGLGARWECY